MIWLLDKTRISLARTLMRCATRLSDCAVRILPPVRDDVGVLPPKRS